MFNTTYLKKKKLPTDAIKDTVIGDVVQLDFSKTSCINGTDNETHTSNNCKEETNGLYSETTSLGTTYYFRGTVNNNWVKFGKMGSGASGDDIWWRIIRINEDETVRLIYAGIGNKDTVASSDKVTGVGGYWMSKDYGINNTGYAFNKNNNQNAYVGYMYGTPESTNYNTEHGYDLIAQNHQSELTSSDAKTQIDAWYVTNLADEGNMLNGSTGFCGDRTIANYEPSGYTNLGYETEKTYYKAYDRLKVDYQPSFECKNKEDLYTTSSDRGNGALTYPIGLITADEALYAGGSSSTNYGYWLYTGQYYWTLSPYDFHGTYASLFGISSYGRPFSYNVNTTYGLRPVVNLKPEYFKTQDENGAALDGTIEKPYIASAN